MSLKDRRLSTNAYCVRRGLRGSTQLSLEYQRSLRQQQTKYTKPVKESNAAPDVNLIRSHPSRDLSGAITSKRGTPTRLRLKPRAQHYTSKEPPMSKPESSLPIQRSRGSPIIIESPSTSHPHPFPLIIAWPLPFPSISHFH